MRFKKGDRVRLREDIKYPLYGWGDVKPGETGTYLGFGCCSKDHPCVNFPGQSDWSAEDSELELVDEAKNSHEFKVGDRVRIKSDYISLLDGSRYGKGSTGTYQGNNQFLMDKPHDTQVLPIDEMRRVFELVTEEKVAEEKDPRYIWESPYESMYDELLRDVLLHGTNAYGMPKIQPRKKPMAKLSILAKKFLDADTRVLVKAGVLDNELNVADSEFVMSFLVNLYKEDLAKEAKRKIREDKKEEEEE